MKLALSLDLCSGRVMDADVASFLSRAVITNPTQIVAVSNLAAASKAHGWWNQCDCIYPMVGGTFAAHGTNLKSNLYVISWIAAPTHDANGVTFNGTTQFGDPGYNPTSVGGLYTQNSAHIFWYVKASSMTFAPNSCPMGAGGIPANVYMGMRKNGANGFIIHAHDAVGASGGIVVVDDLGASIATRTTALASGFGNKAVWVADGASSSVGNVNQNIYIGAEDNAGIWLPAAYTCNGASIGSGITQAQWNVMRADWDAYQTALGR